MVMLHFENIQEIIVWDNIELFGGDKKRISIFHEGFPIQKDFPWSTIQWQCLNHKIFSFSVYTAGYALKYSFSNITLQMFFEQQFVPEKIQW